MNFQAESFCFFDWLETNSVGPSCVSLWFALLHTWCKAGCPIEFAVARSVLETKTGLGKDAIYDARNKLQQVGRIKWRSRKGNLAAVYILVSFNQTQGDCVGISDANSHAKPSQTTTQYPTQVPTISSRSNNKYINNITTTLNNVPEIPTQIATQGDCVGISDANSHAKPSQTTTQRQSVGNSDANSIAESAEDDPYNPFKHYERLFGLMRPMVIEEISDYLNHGIEEKLVCLTMDRSHEHGAGHWHYAKSILDKCVIGDILTVESFLKTEEQYRLQKSAKSRTDRARGGSQSGGNSKNNQSENQQQDPYDDIGVIKL